MQQSAWLKQQKGFSLMELVITISMIGVLAVVAIPVYRNMKSKSKKAEAKTNLGALASVESFFQSEYGVYGNNLLGMGFEIDGSTNAGNATEANMVYGFGFISPACADLAGVAVVPPPVGNPAGLQISAGAPNYYAAVNTRGRFGRAINGAKNQCGPGATEPVAPNFTGYTAVAAGVIQDGQDLDNSAINDVWTIDQNRQLQNIIDGT